MADFSRLSEKLTQLKHYAAQLDKKRGEHHLPLFDSGLFQCRAKLLVPCVDEASRTFESICSEQRHQRLTTPRAQYLTERLVSQISALQREISTSHFRKDEPKHSSYYRKPINQLYQELAQHKEWERRLQELVIDKNNALEQASGFNRSHAQQEVLKTDQRLERCKQAIVKLEKQITYREQHQ
ncbi:primosomal replication protein [Vibrio gallicus]|uniref:primosomal replication protein n=1 Tax=Vibrio gallicus TaxID=190897 RepID=UPI0021C419D0|nr:primosomal replication protein [Vibrio gallicus]